MARLLIAIAGENHVTMNDEIFWKQENDRHDLQIGIITNNE